MTRSTQTYLITYKSAPNETSRVKLTDSEYKLLTMKGGKTDVLTCVKERLA